MRLKNKLKIHRTFYSPPQFNKIEFIPLNKLRINRYFFFGKYRIYCHFQVTFLFGFGGKYVIIPTNFLSIK
ncbi:hypothetical protein HMPREF9996_00623 [Aggregatibacter actinomycetemcomitans Y4]|nr:hypothetical protein HMPREF9996_00623 [Aggregatibacter actinomycetemcomitans Y4]